MSFNQVTLIGHLGMDPELNKTESTGTAVANFTMAVNTRGPQNKEETIWFRVSAWRRTAELVAERLKKGSQVFVQGPLSMETYTAASGETRTVLKVTAQVVQFLDKFEGSTSDDVKEEVKEEAKAATASDDDIPF